MSEHKIDCNLKVDVPESVVQTVSTPVKNVLNPASKSIGKGLGNIFNVVFNPFKYLSEKQEIKYTLKLQQYKDELQEKLKKIPEEKLCEPDFQTVGTALENSKYCIRSDILRKMFVDLITNSMNVDMKNLVHPSLAQIINQMSPLDAKILSIFSKNVINLPICEYRLKEDDGYSVILTNVTFLFGTSNSIQLNSISLSNLERLGLIDITYATYVTDQALYQLAKEYLDNIALKASNEANDKSLFFKYIMRKGKASLTPLGKTLIKVCLSD